jgi:hypothetical protein
MPAIEIAAANGSGGSRCKEWFLDRRMHNLWSRDAISQRNQMPARVLYIWAF